MRSVMVPVPAIDPTVSESPILKSALLAMLTAEVSGITAPPEINSVPLLMVVAPS